MLGSEMLLYGCSAVCVAMLAFNIVYYLSLNGRDRRMERVSRRLRARVERQLDGLRLGGEIENSHLAYLRRRLAHITGLTAFDKMLTGYWERGGGLSPELGEYYRGIRPVILHLAVAYREKEDIQAAYFAWFLAKHKINQHMELDAVQEILVDYMNLDSLYCRVNAFQALCSLGNPRCVAQAVAALDRNQKFFHSKLLTDSLLGFTGSKRELDSLLLEGFSGFYPQTKLSVLNYIRFSTGSCRDWVLALMEDPEEDKEVRLSAIRYFGRYAYPPARPALLAFSADKDPLHWEYAAISAAALAAYEGQDVADALAGAVTSSNWYVRSNAAASLASRGMEYDDLMAVAGGGDRYARDMVLYQMQLRRASGGPGEGVG